MGTLHAVRANKASTSQESQPEVQADWFAEFYSLHFREVVGLAYSLTGSWPAAEDIAQEAFVRVYRDRRRVETFERPDSWLRTVTVNLARSRGRRLATEAKALTRLFGRRQAISTDALPDDAEAFWSAVRRLPPRQAKAVALRYHSDLSVAEVAEVMGCAEGTAKAHLHAARQSIAAEMGVLTEDGSDD